MKAEFRATGTAKMEVIKGGGDRRDIASINDLDELRKIAQERNIAFAPTTTVERMKKRLMEGWQ